MTPRGNRLACTLRTIDGAQGSYDVHVGDGPGRIGAIDPVKWSKPPEKGVLEGAFTVIGDLGMTGQVILVNQYQWKALVEARLEPFFYAALLWGRSPFKVIEDAEMMLKRGK